MRRARWGISAIFFIYGLTFASWATRIPTIQQYFNLSDAGLGSLLLALPFGSFISLPIAAYLVAKFNSKVVVQLSILSYILSLLLISFIDSIFILGLDLFLLGLMGNTLNIAINTQAVILSKLYKRPILASFHGMWSLAGFAGAAVGAILIALNKSIAFHYAIIFGLNLFLSLFVFRYLLASDKSKTESSQPIFTLPDRSLLVLGLIAFCSMLIEGTMFDWTGVYFKNIVQAPPQWVGMGYVAFMISMAAMRFVADKMTLVYGVKTIIMVSGMLSFIGLSLVILFPVIITSLVGFLIVGVGVSSVIPLVFAAAGNTTKMAPSAALASVSSMGFFGFLIGPPMVGFMAEAFGLQFSFAVIAFIGLFTVLLASRIRQV